MQTKGFFKRVGALFGAQDMTKGSPVTNLIKFSVPLLIGNFVQQLYSAVDAMVVGKYLGNNAVAAVGTTFSVVNLLLVLFIAISTGVGIVVSQYFGAKEREQLSLTVGNAMIVILITCIVTSIVGLIITRPLLRLIGTPPEIFDWAVQYMEILMIGLIGVGFYNILTGILRGLGDSVSPLLFLSIACGLNIVLDIVFVANFGWGVAGVAIATIISQTVSAVLCFIKLLRMRSVLDLNRRTLRVNGSRTAQMFKLGLPSGVTQAVFSLAMVFVQALTNSLGTVVVTAMVMVMRVDGFAIMPSFSFGMATSTYVGQNIGAGRMDRVQKGVRVALCMSVVVGVVLVSSILIFGRSLLMLFTETTEIIDLGMRGLSFLAVGYLAMGIMQVFAGILRGAGDTQPSMWISLFTSVALRVPIAYAWAHFSRSELWPNGSPDSLFVSMLIAWTVGALLNYLWYRRGTWREKSIIRKTYIET